MSLLTSKVVPMKRIIVLSLFIASLLWSAEPPFHRGVNLTNWFQVSSAGQIQFTKFTRQDLINIKSLGCDVVRLPIDLHSMTAGRPDYTVDPLFYYFLDQVVDMAEELGLHLIFDNHTFDPSENTDPNIGDALIAVWTQIAGHYKNRSTYLYYEVLNEPHGISDAVWNTIQQSVVQAVRTVDQTHTIIIGPAGWNSYSNLQYMPNYADDNLIYTFHFYDPFIFTHQGADWTDPSMASLAGVPFPYDAARMPVCPPELVGSWVQSSVNNYHNDGTVARVKQLIDIAAAFKNQRNVPLYCGEFGAYIPNSNNDDRIYYYTLVRSYLEEKGIAWTTWDYRGGFGLFEAGTSEMFDYDLNIPLLEALGFQVPPQSEFVLKPDTTGFDLYGDFIAPNILESSWADQGIVDYYSEDNPVGGRYCIYWSGVNQYNAIGFTFRPIKDLSVLVDKGYAIDFWVRGDSPGAQFDIRFIDTKTDDPADHPWRMRMTIDETLATWDGEWNHLQIPLRNFTEHGSWDGEWFSPRGDFDWAAVDLFQIVAEYYDLKGIKFWFDNIRLVDPKVVSVDIEEKPPRRFKLLQNYPNPFNPTTTIHYQLSANDHVEIAIYNLKGQKVRSLVNEIKIAGTHTVVWDGRDDAGIECPGGVYFCRMRASDFRQVRKLILIR
jgi:endoglucanase